MRLYGTIVGLALALGLAGSASAQSSFFPTIGQTQNVMVDTRDATLPIAQPMTTNSAWSRLTSFFPLTAGTMWYKPTGGVSTFPTPSQMPNGDYLKAFGFYRARQTSSSSSWFGR